MASCTSRLSVLFVFVLCVVSGLLHAQSGALDGSFSTGAGPSSMVQDVVIQPDGKVLIAGTFFTVDGVARRGIARLNTNGSVDSAFDTGAGPSSWVSDMALQPDGKILIGGGFHTVDGVGRKGIARLNTDGSLDTSFDPGSGVDVQVYSVALQPDGKVLIGGPFSQVNGVGRERIARLNADGSLDTTFDPGVGPNNDVDEMALQSNGKILIGGGFSVISGQARQSVARLNADGSLDTTFNSGIPPGFGSRVRGIQLQPNGQIVIAGSFHEVFGVSRLHVARLNANGTLDTSFDPGTGVQGYLRTALLQSDGKILVGGLFSGINGVQRYQVARLNSNGSVDTSFDVGMPTTGGEVMAIGRQSDGKPIIGGLFTHVGSVARKNIARLLDASATQPLTISSASTLPDGDEGAAYNFTFSGAGGTQPYAWSVPSGGQPLPAGWVLDANGNLSAAAQYVVVGTFSLDVELADAGASTPATKNFIVTINPAGGGGGGGAGAPLTGSPSGGGGGGGCVASSSPATLWLIGLLALGLAVCRKQRNQE